MRGARRIAVAAVLAAMAARGGAAEEPPAPPAPDAPAAAEFQKRVDGAIALGVAWLRERQQRDGGWDVRPIRAFHVPADGSVGPTALALYTLRSCGVAREDPAVARGFQRLREIYLLRKKQRQGGLDTYGVSLALLALESHHAAPAPQPGPAGTTPAPAPPSRRIPEEDLSWIRELASWLVQAQRKDGAFSYWSPAQGPGFDFSNGQFALLALKAARRCGIDLPRGLWKRAAERLLDGQQKSGPSVERFEPPAPAKEGETRPARAKDRARGWGYATGLPATGSMTAGGVSSLVICRSELLGGADWSASEDAKVEQAIRDGLAWLGAAFTPAANPAPANAPALAHLWQYYWLYGVERAGELADVVHMGRHDWYREGAAYLLDQQRDDGSWISQQGLDAGGGEEVLGPDSPTANFLDTCFALLFLKRATPKVDRGGVATADALASIDLDGAHALDARAFSDLFDAVFARCRAAAAGPDRDARTVDFVRLGVRSLPLLVRALEAEREEDRATAIAVLRRTTGVTRGFDAAAPVEARAAAAALWEEWWMASKDRVQADAASGRFLDPGR